MGVPRLAKYIKENHMNGDSVITLPREEKDREIRVDCFYIDSNALIHQAAQSVFCYGKKERIMMAPKIPREEGILRVYKMYFDSVEDLIDLISPKKLVYLAIDGCAPIAKEAQQRSRRFISALSNTHVSNFNSAEISPGTVFMRGLGLYCKYRIRELLNRRYHHLRIIFSSSNSPGEGEHKILEFMRSTISISQSKSHCMYGPDADLFMLTLGSPCENIYLLRDNFFVQGEYDFYDMSSIRVDIESYYLRNDNIDNFLFLGFFVGNDFLPKLQAFMYLEDGMLYMREKYSLLQEPISKDKKLNLNSFRKFIKLLKSEEQKLIFDQHNKAKEEKFINHTLLRCISDEGVLDFAKYRKDYYHKAGLKNDEDMYMMCMYYIRGLCWVFQYYTSGIPSWKYCYKYHYAPLMHDLYDVLEQMKSDEFEGCCQFNLGKAHPPLVQLLCILPPKSAYILPSKLRHLLDKNSPIKQYYPDEFELDFEGKTEEYMAIALLPFIEEQDILDAYEKEELELVFLKRNNLTNNVLFVYDKTFLSSFHCKYGNIEKNKVKTIKLDE